MFKVLNKLTLQNRGMLASFNRAMFSQKVAGIGFTG